jgi:hypothetical protein
VLVPIVIYFSWHHALGYLWEDAFRFNTQWYTAQPKSFGDHFRTIKRCLDAGNYEIPFMIALVLGSTSLFMRHRRKGLLIAAMAALFLSFSAELLGNRFGIGGEPADYPYYFLPLSGTVCVLLFVVFAFADETGLGIRKFQLPYAILLCCSLSYTALQHGTHLVPRDKNPVIGSPEMRFLLQHRPGDYDLYIFNYDDYIYAYNELHIFAPSRWIYQHMWNWYDKWDPDHALLASIAGDLQSHKTTYVILDPSRLDLFVNPADAAYWMSFMRTNYQPLPVPGTDHSILWKRKSAP